jgi:hypothetical protein
MSPITVARSVTSTGTGPSNDLIAAMKALADIYGEEACAEALARAFVSERTQKREDARFWVEVCARLFDQPPPSGETG